MTIANLAQVFAEKLLKSLIECSKTQVIEAKAPWYQLVLEAENYLDTSHRRSFDIRVSAMFQPEKRHLDSKSKCCWWWDISVNSWEYCDARIHTDQSRYPYWLPWDALPHPERLL